MKTHIDLPDSEATLTFIDVCDEETGSRHLEVVISIDRLEVRIPVCMDEGSIVCSSGSIVNGEAVPDTDITAFVIEKTMEA